MKKFTSIFLVLVLTSVVLVGCAKDNQTETKHVKGETIKAHNYSKDDGADSYDNAGDHKDSKYYVNPDFYNMVSDKNLTMLSKFKTMQQTTEYSCGAASVTMILNHFGIAEYDEMDLCILGNVSVDKDKEGALPGTADNYYEYGANVEKVIQMLSGISGVEVVETSYVEQWSEDQLLSAKDGVTDNDIGNLPGKFSSSSLYASENSDTTQAWVEDAKDSYFVQWITNHIKNNNCIMVEWGDWDGHWQVIVGYDTMGTPSMGDDMIIFADPYDTSDHWQDGYYYYPAERWFYMWKDRNVAKKPFQLQPFVVISGK